MKAMKKIRLRYVAVLMALAAFLSVSLWIYYRNSRLLFDETMDQIANYERHYLFVCSDSSDMWQQIYNYAAEAGYERDAVLEWAGQDSPVSYSPSQCMEIGISSHADGMIVCPDGSEDMAQEIRKATEAGIPVVTLLKDSSSSGRVSFVGVSNYQMGELYGKETAALLDGENNSVCLLLDMETDELAANLIYSQIMEALNTSQEGTSATVSVSRIDPDGDFEAEEAIRNILVEDDRPDILICTSPVQTECALTAIIDYNLVSEVQIIGYYASEEVQSAIRRGLIPVSLTIDPKEAGEMAIEAMDEYISSGHVSDYFNLSIDTVDADNVFLYIRKTAGRENQMEGAS